MIERAVAQGPADIQAILSPECLRQSVSMVFSSFDALGGFGQNVSEVHVLYGFSRSP